MSAVRGVIAAGHQLTAGAGAAVLRDGGSAIDAVIAALAMASVCEPVLCSPGGGGFAMVRDAGRGAVSVIDFFPHTPTERATAFDDVTEIHADFGTATQAFHIGPATTATPGFFSGIEALHRRGATRPLGELAAPAARAAREGITVTPFQHHLSTVVKPILTATPGAARLFAPGGAPLTAGETFRNPGLADALEILAREGLSDSVVGQACVTQQRERGHVTADDLGRYRPIPREPLSVSVGDSIVHLNPLPAAGGVLIAHSLRHLHTSHPFDIARAFRATNRARRETAGDLRALAALPVRHRGTTHVSVVDADGMACAVTVSNGEGNGELVDGFGFMLNNVLGEEAVNPDGSEWPVDTRLSSMMCPTMIEFPDGALVALGSGGSNRISTAICQVLVQLCMADRGLRDAIEAPRLHVEGEHLDVEPHFESGIIDALRAAFTDHHVWPSAGMFFGGVHAVRSDADAEMSGVGDARRGGTAIVVH